MGQGLTLIAKACQSNIAGDNVLVIDQRVQAQVRNPVQQVDPEETLLDCHVELLLQLLHRVVPRNAERQAGVRVEDHGVVPASGVAAFKRQRNEHTVEESQRRDRSQGSLFQEGARPHGQSGITERPGRCDPFDQPPVSLGQIFPKGLAERVHCGTIQDDLLLGLCATCDYPRKRVGGIV